MLVLNTRCGAMRLLFRPFFTRFAMFTSASYSIPFFPLDFLRDERKFQQVFMNFFVNLMSSFVARAVYKS
jgi:hypothetical protein